MRTYVLAFVLGAVLFGCAGCMTWEQVQRQTDLVKREREEVAKLIKERSAAYAMVEAKTREIRAKMEAGSLSSK